MPLLHPASVQAQDLRGVWIIFLSAAALVAAVVYALIFYSLARWRVRSSEPAGLPPQFKTNARWEITGVAIPLLMVFGLFYITYVRELAVDRVRAAPFATVDVMGYQWSWSFKYPGSRIRIHGTPPIPPVLVLPVGKLTQINLSSADVDHSFWVPAFLFKRDALPGMTNHFDVTPDRVGTFRGVCAEYCGLDHALMTFRVRVVPVASYQRWLKSGGSASL